MYQAVDLCAHGVSPVQQERRRIAGKISPTLATNELVSRMRTSGRDILHMGFGQAPFPVHPRLRQALRDNAAAKDYLPIAGLPQLRSAIAEHQASHADIDMDAFDVVVGPGSKALLFALQMAIPGDILLPVPSWVSYSPQANLLGQQVIPVVADATEEGFILKPATIHHAVRGARSAGCNPTKLLINFPNNPTGLTIDDESLSAIADVCRETGLILISDEIYGRLSYDHRYRSAAKHFPQGTAVTTGLSKHLSLGGWRLGIALIPKAVAGLFENVCHIASETWSCVATPIQLASVDAYASHADVEKYIATTTDIHACINRHIAAELHRIGVDCCSPQGGFYTWPDFGAVLGDTYKSSEDLARDLLEQCSVATLPGVAFGEEPETLRLRLSGCDYDGRGALKAWKSCREEESVFVQQAAPNVVTALHAIKEFIERSRNSR